MKILTFNHHESYLCSLSDLGYEMDVVIKYESLELPWKVNQRTPPTNLTLVNFDETIKHRLKNGYYDVVICHTIKNLLWLFWYFTPRYIFIAHIPLFFYNPSLFLKAIFKKLIYQVFKWTHKVKFFAVSEFKRRMWKEQGTVAVLSPQHFPLVKYSKENIQIVVVGNEFKERGIELGYPYIESLASDFPINIIGVNPHIPKAFKPNSFEEFQERFSECQIYLYTISYPYGDGYNTAMLEAMNMGMAVVTVVNPSSPITHNKNGLVAKNLSELREHLNYLLSKPEEIKRLGQAAKKTIQDKFSKEQFIEAWRDLLAKTDEPLHKE